MRPGGSILSPGGAGRSRAFPGSAGRSRAVPGGPGRCLVGPLNKINVQMTLKDILLGGEYTEQTQMKIHRILLKYLQRSGRTKHL